MIIGLLTLDAQIYNYGGLLLEYALYKTLQKLGHKVEIINYDVGSELNTFSYKRDIKYLSIDKIVRKIAKKVSRKSHYVTKDIDLKSKYLFDSFRCEHLQISQRYFNSDLKEIHSAYDGFVCGSDQIWNPTYNIPSFFLTFVKKKNKVIYAASIGVSSLSRIEKKSYAVLLSDLKYISVREEKAKEMLSPLTSSLIQVVLDPTMILDREEWKKFIRKNSCQRPYVFCYFLGQSEEKSEAAQKYAKENNLELIAVPLDDCNQSEREKGMEGIGPIEFLNLIYYANFILTDSFHASVFSILYGKNFRVFSRNVGSKNMDDRIHTLLKLIGRESLLIRPKELETSYSNDDLGYNYFQIDEQRVQSLRWLENALKKEKGKEDA